MQNSGANTLALRLTGLETALRYAVEGTRRRSGVCALALSAILGGAPVCAQLELELQPLVSGLNAPVAISNAKDGRLFIVEKSGVVKIFDGDQLLAQPFLDIRDRVVSGGERGLLSLEFDPQYATNGYFFVNYTGGADLAGPSGNAADTVVARFSVSNDAALADPNSEQTVIIIDQDFSNHNGGQIKFGADGYLYIGTGDGGMGNDPLCRAQDGASLLGKMLRLDVSDQTGYAIPADNPFVGLASVRDEIWALGLRNPWRFSFDRLTADLYIGDVGQNAREEVDFEPAAFAGGRNYGWKVMEGNLCANPPGTGCGSSAAACFDQSYTAPIIEYTHSEGCSITGGYVYRGQQIPALYGYYLYGDYCTGTIWAAKRTGQSWQVEQLTIGAPVLTTFGLDQYGEVYLAASDTLYRIVDPDSLFHATYESLPY